MTKTIQLINKEKRDLEGEAEEEKEEEEEEEEEIGVLEEEEDSAEIDKGQFPIIDNSIQHMHCGARTLQLGIEDDIKTGPPATFIAKLQHIAQKLRAPNLDSVLKRQSGKGAIMMNRTRWGTKLAMAERTLELKLFIKDLAVEEVQLTDRQWEQLEDLIELLKIPQKATISLQKATLTPGECLLEWREVVFRLKKIGSNVALNLAHCIEFREKKLLETDVFMAAGEFL